MSNIRDMIRVVVDYEINTIMRETGTEPDQMFITIQLRDGIVEIKYLLKLRNWGLHPLGSSKLLQ